MSMAFWYCSVWEAYWATFNKHLLAALSTEKQVLHDTRYFHMVKFLPSQEIMAMEIIKLMPLLPWEANCDCDTSFSTPLSDFHFSTNVSSANETSNISNSWNHVLNVCDVQYDNTGNRRHWSIPHLRINHMFTFKISSLKILAKLPTETQQRASHASALSVFKILRK